MARVKGLGSEPEAKENDAQNQPDPAEEARKADAEREQRALDQGVQQKEELKKAEADRDPRDAKQEPDPSALMDRSGFQESPKLEDDAAQAQAQRDGVVRDPAVPGQPPGAVFPDRA
jgi:hypothetical protein